MMVWKSDKWKWLDRKACDPAILLYTLTVSNHKIGLLAHNFMGFFFPSLVRLKLYAIVFTQGRSRDRKLQGAAGLRQQTDPFDW